MLEPEPKEITGECIKQEASFLIHMPGPILRLEINQKSIFAHFAIRQGGHNIDDSNNA